MEAINGSLPFPMYENLNQDSAIRQFCAARVQQEQGGEWGEILLEMDLCPHFDCTPPLATSEVEEIVDSFFNVECYEKDNANKSSDDENGLLNQYPEEGLQDFSEIDGFYYDGDVPMMMTKEGELEECGSCNDLGFCTIMEPSIKDVVDQGLHLVQLLLACAEAVGCRDTQLADTILSQIWSCVSPWGDSLQRVSYCFAMGLKNRLCLLQNVNSDGSFSNGASDVSLITREEKNEALDLLHQTTPYIAFGFMAANDAISQAATRKDSLHIIDLGMEHNLQWPSLVRTLGSRAEGPPKLVRITGIIGVQDPLELEASLKGLVEDASSLGIHLEFKLVAEPVSTSVLTDEKLELRAGEALFVNSFLHLHKHVKESRGSLKTILQTIKKLNPVLLTMVEQDANHNGPFFLGRFLESLHYYSAIFDSLEASIPRTSPERLKIEKFHFAEQICNVIAFEGSNRIERHERADQWRRQLARAGFQVVGMKCMNQARLMISVYGCDGYTVSSEKGCLLLGWKGRPIMLASAWQLHNAASS
ncbi:DELLA RGL1-like [Olea europaea subsp. europaea]|uniref:DELLA RGL1-like n=1 Tax=Olea europaea subsp. europaea TaxID=158383 RepID=A0A8S0R7T5_OLEEU|nr:DELLA RGL1-like [Olea europaea subsp. europaea]